MVGSENTTNRVYVASKEFGWLPAKILSTDGPNAKVEVKDYEEDIHIPACEVSDILNPSAAQKKRGIKTLGSKELEINLKDKNYAGGVLPLQNVDEDGKLIEVEDMVDLSFLHEVRQINSSKRKAYKNGRKWFNSFLRVLCEFC